MPGSSQTSLACSNAYSGIKHYRGGGSCCVPAGARVAATSVKRSATTSACWRKIVAGVGLVGGETKIDPQIEVSAKLARYCVDVRIAALAVYLFATEKVHRTARDARVPGSSMASDHLMVACQPAHPEALAEEPSPGCAAPTPSTFGLQLAHLKR